MFIDYVVSICRFGDLMKAHYFIVIVIVAPGCALGYWAAPFVILVSSIVHRFVTGRSNTWLLLAAAI